MHQPPSVTQPCHPKHPGSSDRDMLLPVQIYSWGVGWFVSSWHPCCQGSCLALGHLVRAQSSFVIIYSVYSLPNVFKTRSWRCWMLEKGANLRRRCYTKGLFLMRMSPYCIHSANILECCNVPGSRKQGRRVDRTALSSKAVMMKAFCTCTVRCPWRWPLVTCSTWALEMWLVWPRNRLLSYLN